MTPRHLADLIMSQTAVLVAQLSTSAGLRAPLGDIAGRTFLGLSKAIEAQGVPKRLAADMFGMALRGYQKKIARLSDLEHNRGSSLWQEILDHVESQGACSRHTIETHFAYDDGLDVAAVLHDLVQCGFLQRTGGGDTASYRVVDYDEAIAGARRSSGDELRPFLLLLIYRNPGVTAEALAKNLNLSQDEIEEKLEGMFADGAVRLGEDGVSLQAGRFWVPVGAEEGWEAAVFDHFRAVATAIGAKLRAAQHKSEPDDRIGGTTLSFDVSPEHPHYEEVMALLQRTRTEANQLWSKVQAWNERVPLESKEAIRLTYYFGQFFVPLDEPDSNPKDVV